MKIFNQMNLVFLFTIILLGSLSAQGNLDGKKYSEIIPNHTDLRIIHSPIIDEDYFLYIKLPRDYNQTDKNYPVVYLLDGDIAFTLAWSSVRYLQYGKHVPDVIIVGVGYGSLLSSKERNMRERDYTVSELERWEGSGGGKKFVEFMKSRIIPYIDSEFRTNPKLRVLNGYSLGGLIVLYTYLTENSLFSGYIAGSPYISSDVDLLSGFVQKNSSLLINSKAKLFISYGELEEKEKYGIPIENIFDELSLKKIGGIKKRVFEDGTHFTCPSEAMVYGLKYIFE